MRDFNALEQRILETAKNSGLYTELLAKMRYNEQILPLYQLSSQNKDPRICISAGIHADEVESIDILLKFLIGRKDLISRASLAIFPCANPRGYVAGNRQEGIEINRSFDCEILPVENRILELKTFSRTYDLFVDIHGDTDEKGFYCYERKPKFAKSLAREVVGKIRKEFEICTKNIDNEKNNNGVINSAIGEHTFEEFMADKSAYSLTLEFPGALAFEKRIECGYKALTYAVEGILRMHSSFFRKIEMQLRQFCNLPDSVLEAFLYILIGYAVTRKN